MADKRTFLNAILSILLLILAFMSGFFLNAYLANKPKFPILTEAYGLLHKHGLAEVPPEPSLEYGMIQGMLGAYNDPHTVFIEPAQHELQTNTLEGKYGSIGVDFGKDAEGFWVVFPHPESPASLAGIQEGDRLLVVEDLTVKPDTPEESIQSAIRGPIGERVKVMIGRQPDYEPMDFSIKRQEFAVPSVDWHLEPSQPLLGIVDVNIIAASTPDEIKNAINDLQKRGATHIALDLRDNPGGLLNAGVEIARLFLQSGIVMEQQYRDQDVETYEVSKPGPYTEIPLVVLINHSSASAAEIAAGALQIQQRAFLIGAPSFGKDTIQLVFELRDKSSLHITAAKWWLPGMTTPLQNNGLQPDILVDGESEIPGVDLVILAAIKHFFGTH